MLKAHLIEVETGIPYALTSESLETSSVLNSMPCAISPSCSVVRALAIGTLTVGWARNHARATAEGAQA